MTRRTRDGGRDIEITRDAPGQREVAHVECKLWTGPVGVTEVRNLLGVVSTELVSRGVLVTNSRFTEPARKLSAKDRRVELLDGDSLLPLLDQHLGADWSKYVDRVITESMRRTGFPEQASPPAG